MKTKKGSGHNAKKHYGGGNMPGYGAVKGEKNQKGAGKYNR